MPNKGKPNKLWRRLGRNINYVRNRHGPQIVSLLDLPFKIVFSPLALALNLVGSAPRGFGVPEFISNVSRASILVVATLGAYDIALDMGRKVVSKRDCKTCSGWRALQCTMCKGTGKVRYQVKYYTSESGEKVTAQRVADAVMKNRAELVHLPSAIGLDMPLPTKECATCDGTGVMSCPTCKTKFPLRISPDDIMEPPWKAYSVMRQMHYPYEHIAHSMKDPSIAAFWLITMPQLIGGFSFDEEVKQKIWWQYMDSMRYDRLRDVVAQRQSGWEHLQQALVRLDPDRARDDPVVVKNVPYYQMRKMLEPEVSRLEPPPRPQNWGDLNLPLDESSWSKEDLKDPKKMDEMQVLLNAQKEIADKFLDAQWEAKWREDKLNEMLEEKVRPYIQDVDSSALSRPIVIPTLEKEVMRKPRPRRWWFF